MSVNKLRFFGFSAVSTVLILVGVAVGMGAEALLLTLILTVVEVTFSFDNAIINAKVLAKLTRPWQTVFLTVGIVIAIFGMRIIFPLLIVVMTAHLGWHDVINLALHHPEQYAEHLEAAHATIAAFGGAFLLMLALTYFMDDEKQVHWIRKLELRLKKLSHWSIAPAVVVVAIVVLARIPANTKAGETLVAGLLGAATFILIQLINTGVSRLRGKSANKSGQTGLVAVSSLLYLEILDASFSFDGVVGAFAITSDVVLIAAGLGIGALWVRSLTVYMVRESMLGKYIYVEHGAHYTVFALAVVLLVSVVWEISNLIPGLVGIIIIGSSVAASLQAARAAKRLRQRQEAAKLPE